MIVYHERIIVNKCFAICRPSQLTVMSNKNQILSQIEDVCCIMCH